MAAYAHGVLIVKADQSQGEHQWVVYAREDQLEVEGLEGTAGPRPNDYTHQIAMLGGRGWEMFQILEQPKETEFWFRKQLD